jgi:RNA polymerase sigma-70 factor (ECF subfamily)
MGTDQQPNRHGEGQDRDGLPRCEDRFDFERIYQMYSRRVFSLCLRTVGNRAEAEDLTQEAFLLLFRKIGTFRGESAFRTWLFRLVTNVVLMRLRRKRSTWQESSLDNDSGSEVENHGRACEFGAADCKLVGAIDRLNLERAVGRLPHGFRMVFLLHDVEGYNHVEIAGMLGLAVGTSKSQLHKARCRLRLLLRATGPRYMEEATSNLKASTDEKLSPGPTDENRHKGTKPLSLPQSPVPSYCRMTN